MKVPGNEWSMEVLLFGPFVPYVDFHSIPATGMRSNGAKSPHTMVRMWMENNVMYCIFVHLVEGQ